MKAYATVPITPEINAPCATAEVVGTLAADEPADESADVPADESAFASLTHLEM